MPLTGLPARVGDYNPVMPSLETLSNVGARLLDPATAVVFGSQRVRPTVYLANQLLMLNDKRESVMPHLRAAAVLHEVTVDEQPLANASGYSVVQLRPASNSAARVVDAWPVLQAARLEADPNWNAAGAHRDGPELAGLELNHLMYITPMTPMPYNDPHPYETPGVPYADLAYTGPRPVAFVLGLPEQSALATGKPRRPVVAVVDTGCANHPDLNAAVKLQVVPGLGGVPGAVPPYYEYYGDPNGPLDGQRDLRAGHGTFICGLVRQACPDAQVFSVPVMEANGTIPKNNLLMALEHIAALVQAKQDNQPNGVAIDVVSISMGFYEELPIHAQATALLRVALEKLTSLGVIVVMSAGNDCTSRKVYPAALAEKGKYPWTCDLLVSVGALNPDGSTVAQFSNSGSWVTTWENGAAVVSTMPVDFQFSRQPPIRTKDLSNRDRAGVDGDDFQSGYAIASGTSYATPIIAGKIAQHLLDEDGALEYTALAKRLKVVEYVIKLGQQSELASVSPNGKVPQPV